MEEETLIQKNVFIQRPAMNQVNFKRQLLLFVSIVVVDVKISTEWSKDVPSIMEEEKMVQKNARKMLYVSTKL